MTSPTTIILLTAAIETAVRVLTSRNDARVGMCDVDSLWVLFGLTLITHALTHKQPHAQDQLIRLSAVCFTL